MSEKYSDQSFFFANYGCCIPTESYAWILVALFVTAIVVLLFCMLATATIRWMYKRRMRKRLHDLKRKFLMDQLKAQEFEAKLNYMAQRNKSTKNDDFSKEVDKEKFTIFVDPAQQQAQLMNSARNKKKNSNNQKVAQGNVPIYDRDETPIAQSTLASKSNTNAETKNEKRWLYLPKNQKPKQFSDDPPSTLPSPHPQPTPVPPIAPVALENPAIDWSKVDFPPTQKKISPKKITPDVDFGTSPIIPLDPNDVSPEGKQKNPLGPPSTATSTVPPTPSGFTTTPTSDITTATPSGTTPETTPSSGTSDSFTVPLAATNPSATKSTTPPKTADDVKQNLQYGMDDIVSPLGPENKGSDRKEVRKEGGGTRSQWKYYSMTGDKNRTSSSVVTKSSASNRRSGSKSWLFDSTGSNRFESASSGTTGTGSGKTNSTVSSSILKTDSSLYKSVEQFPHGAFTFQ